MGDTREQRGRELAERGTVKRQGDLYLVPSEKGSTTYSVDLTAPDGATCTCPDHEAARGKCKHVHAAEYAVLMDAPADGEDQPAAPVPRRTYAQDWPAYNAAQRTERGHFAELLRALCRRVAQPEQTMGRPRYPLSDIIFALVWRTYSGKSLRRVMPELDDWRARDFVETVPHFNTLVNYDKREETTAVLRALVEESALPLRAVETSFASDSTGLSTSRFARWYDEKWGRERTGREWIKLHLMIGTRTHVVSAVEVTRGFGDDTSDARQFPALLTTTARRFKVKECSGDKAYLSRKNLAAVVAVGGTPFIPFKANSTAGKAATLWSDLFHYYNYRRDEFMSHYHKRSNVETAISMLKGKFGDAVKARTETAQVNDVLCKVLAHNLCCLVASIYELGITPEFYQAEAV